MQHPVTLRFVWNQEKGEGASVCCDRGQQTHNVEP